MFVSRLAMKRRWVRVQFWYLPILVLVEILNQKFYLKIFEYAGVHKVLEFFNEKRYAKAGYRAPGTRYVRRASGVTPEHVPATDGCDRDNGDVMDYVR